MDSPRRRTRDACVDQEDRSCSVHLRDQRRCLAAMLDDLDAPEQYLPKLPRNGGPGRIIAAVRISDPENDAARTIIRHGQPRSISSRRKCAEQEMQGS